MHHQYSSSVSPFHANTGTPAGVGGAVRADRDGRGGVILRREDVADAQRTSAPSSTSVSMSTAVWIVMCSEPVMRAPVSGCLPVLGAQRHEAGHLVLGEFDLLAAVGDGLRGEVCDLVIKPRMEEGEIGVEEG